jgi:hypothetical protein
MGKQRIVKNGGVGQKGLKARFHKGGGWEKINKGVGKKNIKRE